MHVSSHDECNLEQPPFATERPWIIAVDAAGKVYVVANRTVQMGNLGAMAIGPDGVLRLISSDALLNVRLQ